MAIIANHLLWVVDLTLTNTLVVFSVGVRVLALITLGSFGTMDSGSSPSRRGGAAPTSEAPMSQDINWEDLKLMIDGENIRYALCS